MNERPDRPASGVDRRFRLWELLVYMLLVAIAAAALSVAALPLQSPLERAIGIAGILGLPALIGAGVFALAFGRRHTMLGAVLGAILVPAVALVGFVVAVHKAHNRPFQGPVKRKEIPSRAPLETSPRDREPAGPS